MKSKGIKLDMLAFGAHPDDVELSCSGTLLACEAQGGKTGIVDLTRGEKGTRGTPAIREKEAMEASKILKISVRENLALEDCFFQNDQKSLLKVIASLRKFRPDVVLANAVSDRHPDHPRGAKLVSEACFYSGLAKIETFDGKVKQQPWRPSKLYHYLQDQYIRPDIIVDITPYFRNKMQSIKAFTSQFYSSASNEPSTYLSSPHFLDFIEARAREMGRVLQVEYGEGFTASRIPGAKNLMHLL